MSNEPDIVHRLFVGAGCEHATEVMEHAAAEILELRAKVSRLEAHLARDIDELATFMLEHSFATGHGDTHADLLAELGPQIKQLRSQRVAEMLLEELYEALKPFAAAAECVPDADCERARAIVEKHK